MQITHELGLFSFSLSSTLSLILILILILSFTHLLIVLKEEKTMCFGADVRVTNQYWTRTSAKNSTTTLLFSKWHVTTRKKSVISQIALTDSPSFQHTTVSYSWSHPSIEAVDDTQLISSLCVMRFQRNTVDWTETKGANKTSIRLR
jgi:hypothetical protein